MMRPHLMPGVRVSMVSAGQHHIAVLDTDQRLWCWGDNDHGQLGPHLPSSVSSTDQTFSYVSSGPGQVLAWSAGPGHQTLPARAPFVIDVCPQTFRLIDQLFTEVWPGVDGEKDWPPSQEQECLTISCLNLLRLLLLAVTQHHVPVDTLSLEPGSTLLTNIKRKVVEVELATHSNVLNTIQRVLESAWPMLLPTADERARALSNLLPHQAAESSQQSSGHRFMTDLLLRPIGAEQ